MVAALAVTAVTPTATRAGNATKLPPPPTEFSAPAAMPASKTISSAVTCRASVSPAQEHNAFLPQSA